MRRIKRRVRRNAVEGNIGTSGSPHYFELTESSHSSLSHIHLKYDATLAATFSYETSDLDEVLHTSTTTGDWVVESSVTIAAAASSAAGQSLHIGNNGALRHRLVVTVTTGGALDIATCSIEQ